MIIQWKQQHINNACVPACVAMLLSQHNIQKEDFEIIYESKRPYLIKFDKSHKSFNAGILIQSPEIINIVPNKYNLEMVQNKFDNFSNYYKKAKNLLNDNRAFLTSLAQGYIPSVGYEQNKSKNGHAVIVHKIEENQFHFLDPDGGINRNERNSFEKVKNLVSYRIHKNELQKILSIRNKYVIGYLKDKTQSNPNVLNLLTKSKQVFHNLSQISREEAIFLISENSTRNYDDFYDFIFRIIKPISLDLKNALLTIPNPSSQERKLISKLEELFQKTIEIQKLLKQNPDLIIRDHLEILLILIDKIEIVTLKVVTEAIRKCH